MFDGQYSPDGAADHEYLVDAPDDEGRLPVLRDFLHAVAESGGHLQLTVVTDGIVISGLAVAQGAWFRAMAQSRREDEALRELLEDLAVKAEAQLIPEPEELRHVNMIDTVVWAPGATRPNLEGTPWQIPLARVGAWTLGAVEFSPER